MVKGSAQQTGKHAPGRSAAGEVEVVKVVEAGLGAGAAHPAGVEEERRVAVAAAKVEAVAGYRVAVEVVAAGSQVAVEEAVEVRMRQWWPVAAEPAKRVARETEGPERAAIRAHSRVAQLQSNIQVKQSR